MQFRENAGVFTANGDKVGHIAKVVMSPRTKEVTHLIVREGFLFTEDKVLPIVMVRHATDEQVTLRSDLGEKTIDNLPRYEEHYFVPADLADYQNDAAVAYPTAGYLYPYGPAGLYGGYPAFWAEGDPRYVERRGENIPDDTIALSTGADVVTSDDRHVGHLEQVIVDEDNDRATHFVIAQGLFFKDRKLVPTSWISGVTQDKVELSVTSGLLARLPSYDPAFT